MRLTDAELMEKYDPLSICSIEERYWAVNGKYLVENKNKEIERLKNIINKLQQQLNNYV